MKNRIVGSLIIGISLLIGLIIYLFNRALTEIVNTSCSHGPTCPMWGSIDFYTNLSIVAMILVVLIGLYLVFFGEDRVTITKIKKVKEEKKKMTKSDYQNVMRKLKEEEKTVFEKIIEADGTIFQSDLNDKTGFDKVKVTRILDRLEGMQLIERRRRGMTNVIILK